MQLEYNCSRLPIANFMIDLHTHSTYSDGLCTPEELCQQAVNAGVKILALTDHDTIAGLEPLHCAARNLDITIINGIELSARWKKLDIHVLGLNINPEDKSLISLIAQQKESRIQRAQGISERLSELGIHDTYQKACELAGRDSVGRPHFAQILVAEGHVKDLQAAFKRFLGRGRHAYVPTAWADIEIAADSIRKAGGSAVIAHPQKYNLTRTKLHELIKTFKIAGGIGIEVVSGEVTQAQIQELSGLCARFELLASTGSDYHGQPLSRIGLGRQQQLPLNCTPVWHQWNI